jgi:hypothetical protein
VNSPNKDIIVSKLTIPQTASGCKVSDLWSRKEVFGSTDYRDDNFRDFIQSTHGDILMAPKMKPRPLLLGRVLPMVHDI